ncbi:MAG: hypothetical protein R2838_16075 [Caldilineaceae bacterium]
MLLAQAGRLVPEDATEKRTPRRSRRCRVTCGLYSGGTLAYKRW